MTMRDQCIEAMARAIVAERGEHPDTIVSQWFGVTDHGGEWKAVGPLWKIEGVPLATAAFDAMINTLMEPTKEMVRIGGAMLPIDDLFAPEEAVLCWQAMLSTLSHKERG